MPQKTTVRRPLEDCPLHEALMNVGYEVYHKDIINSQGFDTGEDRCYYAPAYDPNKMPPGCVRDWSAEPRYVRGLGGNFYPADFVETFPYYKGY
jgi:hypothetical protein